MQQGVAALLPEPFGGARWVTPFAPIANGTFAAYRSTWNVSCGAAKRTATLNIAIDTKYWLYINGELAVWEGGLKRGPTRNGGYYDTVDLSTAKWTDGPNTIAILGLYLGRKDVSVLPPLPAELGSRWHNNEHADSGAHGLLVAATICGTGFATGRAEPGSGTAQYPPFRSIPHPAYTNGRTQAYHRAQIPPLLTHRCSFLLSPHTALCTALHCLRHCRRRRTEPSSLRG